MRVIISLGLVAAFASTPALAKNPPAAMSPYIDALEQCRQIADNAQRLACYDKSAPALVTASKTGEVHVVDRSQLREARRSLFGFQMPKLPFFAGDESAKDTPNKLESTIKAAGEIGYGLYRIVITDGNAVWETTESSMSLHEPRPGQKISISRGPMGSYFIHINGQTGVKGRRVG